MKAMKAIWTLLAAAGLALGLATGSLAADAHKHDHGAAPAKLELNNGKKWATDAPLRQGMENIRKLMQASLHDIHENRLSAAKYGALAKQVDAEVGGIVANCKLEPKADAQLHLVIADIGEGAEAMAGKSKQAKRQAGAVKVLGALDKYGAHFEHPGWQPLAH
jgi:hypothetical protein